MPYPTITERYGSLSATGLAIEETFGTPVPATTFLPMTGNTMEMDPGWFSPELMMAVRDKQVFNLYGEQKNAGTIDGPLFPSNAIEVLAASIGVDGAAGSGVTGTTGTGSTTLSAGTSAGATSIDLTAATGFAVGNIIQVDVNNSSPLTTSECRKIVTLVSTTATLDEPLVYSHLTAAVVKGVVAPFTHTISEANSLPSLTVEKNLGDYQSLQFAGARVGKLSVKAPTGNEPVALSADLSAQSVTVFPSPTAVSITNEMPFVFAEASVSLDSHARADVTNVQFDIDNGLKETWTYSGNHGPSFISPISLHVSGTLDVVWSSLNDSTYGDFTTMENGTLGALALSFTHPGGGGYSVALSCPQVALSKYANDVKFADVIMSSMTFEASLPLTGSSKYTVAATVVNALYLPTNLY